MKSVASNAGDHVGRDSEISTAQALPWHQVVWKQLENAAAEGRIGHALLLVGAAGVGKREFAERLAKTLLCNGEKRRDAPAFGACGQCASCRCFTAGAHPGYRRIALDTTGDGSTIPVDAVRDACVFLAMTAAGGGAKVLVVDHADDLNASGVNALLKTLEEPSSGGYLILTSEAPSKLPATVRSRCQVLRIATPPENVALEYLKQCCPASSTEQREQAVADASGAPLAAAVLVADATRMARNLEWTAQLAQLAAGKLAPLDLAACVQRDDALEFVRHVAIDAWRELRAELQSGREMDPLLRVVRETTNSTRKLASNAQPQLTLESMLVACAAAHPGQV